MRIQPKSARSLLALLCIFALVLLSCTSKPTGQNLIDNENVVEVNTPVTVEVTQEPMAALSPTSTPDAIPTPSPTIAPTPSPTAEPTPTPEPRQPPVESITHLGRMKPYVSDRYPYAFAYPTLMTRIEGIENKGYTDGYSVKTFRGEEDLLLISEVNNGERVRLRDFIDRLVPTLSEMEGRDVTFDSLKYVTTEQGLELGLIEYTVANEVPFRVRLLAYVHDTTVVIVIKFVSRSNVAVANYADYAWRSFVITAALTTTIAPAAEPSPTPVIAEPTSTPEPREPPVESVTEIGRVKPYVSERYPFAFAYPALMTRIEDIEERGYTDGYSVRSWFDDLEVLLISEIELGYTATLDEYLELYLDDVASRDTDGQNSELLSVDYLTTDQGLTVGIVKYLSNRDEPHRTTIMIYVHDGTIAFHVTYISTEWAYSSRVGDFADYTFRSFVITDTP